jgi:maltose alpha-D-glucosyltransferase/alpha-amylase
VSESNNDSLWYKDIIVYQLHVKCFKDSNGDGVIDKLDYIRDLGVTTIWLLPFYPSPLRDDGYDIADYTSVHPDYGTLRDFKRFVREAHRRDLRVLTELVINHTSDQHPWFQAAREAPAGSAKRNFYVWSDTDQKFAETRIIFTDTESSNWAWDATAQAYYWHRFFSHQPDLNHNNPRVVQAVIRLMHFWFDLGVDGLRLDAIPYLCVREGTTNENLPETHQVIKQLRAAMDARFSDRLLLAEANQWPEDAREYFGDGDECNMAYHFPLMPRLYMGVAQEDRYPITEIMRQTPEIPSNCQWAIFLRNHDELTLEMVTDRERDYMYKVYAAESRMRCNVGIRRRLAPLMDNDGTKIRLLNSLLLSMPGTPILYYGDEIGMGDNIYLGDRNGVRTPMQWSVDRNGGFSKADPAQLYLPPIMDPVYGYQAVNVEAQQRSPTSMLNWMRQLIAVRQAHRAFSRGELRFLFPGNRKILAYLRECEGDDEGTILCVANLSRHAQPVELCLAPYRGHVPVELMGRRPFPPIGDLPYFLTLPGHGFYWFLLAQEGEAPAWHVEQSPPQPDLPYLVMTGSGWQWLLSSKQKRVLEQDVLPTFVAAQRWFVGSAEAIERVELIEIGPWGEQDQWLLAMVRVSLVEGGPQLYLLPLAVAWDAGSEDPLSALGGLVLCRVRRAGQTGVLFDGLHDERLVGSLAATIADNGRRSYATDEVRTERYSDVMLGELWKQKIRWGDDESFLLCDIGPTCSLQLYRRLQQEPRGHAELLRVLQPRFRQAYVPELFGELRLRSAQQGDFSLALLFQRLAGVSAWDYLTDHLSRFFDRCVTAPPRDLRTMEDLEGFWTVLSELHLLGARLSKLHRVLASADGKSSQLDGEHRQQLLATLRLQLSTLCQTLRTRESDLDLSHFNDCERLMTEVIDSFPSCTLRTGTRFTRFSMQAVRIHEHEVLFDPCASALLQSAAPETTALLLEDAVDLWLSLRDVAKKAMQDFVAYRAESADALLPWLRRWQSLVADALLAGYSESDDVPISEGELRAAAKVLLLRRWLAGVESALDQDVATLQAGVDELAETFLVDAPSDPALAVAGVSGTSLVGIDELMEAWEGASERVLALDYDGTLAPFQLERMDARPLVGVSEQLDRLRAQEQTRVLIVSGRPLDELAILLPPQGLEMIGAHGCEYLQRDGERQVLSSLEQFGPQLDQAQRALEQLLEPGHDAIERKLASVALHTRKLENLPSSGQAGTDFASALQQRALEAWASLSEQGLQSRRFDGGVEVRVAGVDKGSALARVLGVARAERLEIFVGDDDTDEDAIVAVQKRGGIGVRVGGAQSEARVRLADCQAVLSLLERLAR